MITAGANEKKGGATDREDAAGRLRLLATNANVYRDLVSPIVAAAPDALLLVITDPPDPLADLVRRISGHERVLSSGTFLDSLRFRFHLGERLGVDPKSVEAQVIGEHGNSQVYLWSTARVAGTAIAADDAFRHQVENEVRYANISITTACTAVDRVTLPVDAWRALRRRQGLEPVASQGPAAASIASIPIRRVGSRTGAN